MYDDNLIRVRVLQPGVTQRGNIEEITLRRNAYNLNHRTFAEEIPQHAPKENRLLIDRFDDENMYFLCVKGKERVVGMLCLRTRLRGDCQSKTLLSCDQALVAKPKYWQKWHKDNNTNIKIPKDCSGIEAVLPFFIGRIGEIRLLAVDRNYRNHGIATKMFIAFAKHIFSGKYGVPPRGILVIKGILKMQTMYKNLGFIPFGPVLGSGIASYQPMYMNMTSFLIALFHRLKRYTIKFLQVGWNWIRLAAFIIVFSIVVSEIASDRLFNGGVIENYKIWKAPKFYGNSTAFCPKWRYQTKSSEEYKYIHEGEKKAIAWQGVQLTYLVYIIIASWMFSIPQRIQDWLYIDALNFCKDVPMTIAFVCCDLAIFGAIFMSNWKIPLAITIGCAFVLPKHDHCAPMYNKTSGDKSGRLAIIRLACWIGLLVILEFMEGNMLYFVAQLNPTRFDHIPAFDVWKNVLTESFPNIISFGENVWKPADMEYEVLPILFLLVVNLAGVYPSNFFISPREPKYVVDEALKIVKTIIVSHTFVRPILFTSTLLPSQFHECYQGRFGYLDTHTKLWDKLSKPWETMVGGCNDLLPSGHAIIGTICCLTIAKYRGGLMCWLSWLAWLYTAVMIVGQGHHYSVDIFVGIFIAATTWYICHDGEITWCGRSYAKIRVKLQAAKKSTGSPRRKRSRSNSEDYIHKSFLSKEKEIHI